MHKGMLEALMSAWEGREKRVVAASHNCENIYVSLQCAKLSLSPISVYLLNYFIRLSFLVKEIGT